jgi:integrase
MKIPEPFEHKGRWCVQLSAKLSPTGKRQQLYFASEADAKKDIKARFGEALEHGKSGISAEERQLIAFARQQLGGDLRLLPEIIAHWKATGSGSVTPTTVKDAVTAFQGWRIPKVSARTASDIRWRLDSFAEAFKGRRLHQINAGELEDWIHSHGNDWSVRSFYKRLRPLFDHALRRRWIAENPMTRIKAPEIPGESKQVFTGKQFQDLLTIAEFSTPDYLLAFVALAGFAWFRTSELVRLYSHEDVLNWEDIDWKRDRIHVRSTVGKATRRRSGNERFVPITRELRNWMSPLIKGPPTGRVIPVLHYEFAELVRTMHTKANVPQIHNGLRRSAISNYLAFHPETGIGQLARWAGTSESTIKRHYLESLTPEEGEQWFQTVREE